MQQRNSRLPPPRQALEAAVVWRAPIPYHRWHTLPSQRSRSENPAAANARWMTSREEALPASAVEHRKQESRAFAVEVSADFHNWPHWGFVPWKPLRRASWPVLPGILPASGRSSAGEVAKRGKLHDRKRILPAREKRRKSSGLEWACRWKHPCLRQRSFEGGHSAKNPICA